MPKIMSKGEFRRALEHLGINISAAGDVIGVSKRQALRYGTGDSEVPEAVAKLLRAAVAYKIPADHIRDL